MEHHFHNTLGVTVISCHIATSGEVNGKIVIFHILYVARVPQLVLLSNRTRPRMAHIVHKVLSLLELCGETLACFKSELRSWIVRELTDINLIICHSC